MDGFNSFNSFNRFIRVHPRESVAKTAAQDARRLRLASSERSCWMRSK